MPWSICSWFGFWIRSWLFVLSCSPRPFLPQGCRCLQQPLAWISVPEAAAQVRALILLSSRKSFHHSPSAVQSTWLQNEHSDPTTSSVNHMCQSNQRSCCPDLPYSFKRPSLSKTVPSSPNTLLTHCVHLANSYSSFNTLIPNLPHPNN